MACSPAENPPGMGGEAGGAPELQLRPRWPAAPEAFELKTTLTESGLAEDLNCPICRGVCRKVVVVKECLHRFCAECIEKWLRSGKQDCPECRIKIGSRRALRPDPIFDNVVHRLFPDIGGFENRNDQLIFASNKRRSLSGVNTHVNGRRQRGRPQRNGALLDGQESATFKEVCEGGKGAKASSKSHKRRRLCEPSAADSVNAEDASVTTATASLPGVCVLQQPDESTVEEAVMKTINSMKLLDCRDGHSLRGRRKHTRDRTRTKR